MQNCMMLFFFFRFRFLLSKISQNLHLFTFFFQTIESVNEPCLEIIIFVDKWKKNPMYLNTKTKTNLGFLMERCLLKL